MQSEIEKLRYMVDRLDWKLAKLLSDRAEVVADINRLREMQGRPIRDRAREQQVTAHVVRLTPRLRAHIPSIMKAVIKACETAK